MPANERIPDWLQWMLRHPVVAIGAFTGLVTLVPSLLFLYLDHRNAVREETRQRDVRPAGEPTGARAGRLPRVVVHGERVYVPLYSHVFMGEGQRLQVAGTLSIRNTDAARSLTISKVEYYDTEGKLVRNFLEEPLELVPLGSHDFLVAESDVSGGAGANFIVEWVADEPVVEPIIEAVMVGRDRTGIAAFTRPGVVVEHFGKRAE